VSSSNLAAFAVTEAQIAESLDTAASESGLYLFILKKVNKESIRRCVFRTKHGVCELS